MTRAKLDEFLRSIRPGLQDTDVVCKPSQQLATGSNPAVDASWYLTVDGRYVEIGFFTAAQAAELRRIILIYSQLVAATQAFLRAHFPESR